MSPIDDALVEVYVSANALHSCSWFSQCNRMQTGSHNTNACVVQEPSKGAFPRVRSKKKDDASP